VQTLQEISGSEAVVRLVMNYVAFGKTDTEHSVEGKKLVLIIKPTRSNNSSNLFLE